MSTPAPGARPRAPGRPRPRGPAAGDRAGRLDAVLRTASARPGRRGAAAGGPGAARARLGRQVFRRRSPGDSAGSADYRGAPLRLWSAARPAWVRGLLPGRAGAR